MGDALLYHLTGIDERFPNFIISLGKYDLNIRLVDGKRLGMYRGL